jgi:hypothetical protein
MIILIESKGIACGKAQTLTQEVSLWWLGRSVQNQIEREALAL